jgi:hypothetical protein
MLRNGTCKFFINSIIFVDGIPYRSADISHLQLFVALF